MLGTALVVARDRMEVLAEFSVAAMAAALAVSLVTVMALTVDILGSAAHVLLSEACERLAHSGFDFSLGLHSRLTGARDYFAAGSATVSRQNIERCFPYLP